MLTIDEERRAATETEPADTERVDATVLRQTVRVAMRDGVRLATDVYRPADGARLPVVLHRTPYGRRATAGAEVTRDAPEPLSPEQLARLFVARGYILVVQDCRGRYESDGEFVKYVSDKEDGYDVCAWLMRQPWCDGRICTMGLSYDAHLEASLGCLDPPGLVGQILDCGGLWNAWKVGTRAFGVFELKQTVWAMRNAIQSPEAAADPVMRAALESEDLGAWLRRLPWRRRHSPLRHHPRYEDYLFDQWEHGAFGDYWRKLGIWTEGWHRVYSAASCVHVSGWYDPYVLNAIGNFLGLRAAGRGPQRLILGAFTHGRRSARHAGDIDLGAAAPVDSWATDWRDYRLRFFDEAVGRAPSGEPPVRLFLMGGGTGTRTADGRLDHGGRWITADDWPLPSTRFEAFHLHADGRLAAARPAADAEPLRYRFDPDDPVPTVGGSLASLEPFALPGGFDQVEGPDVFGCTPPYLPLASRADVLVFETQPLDRPVDVAGPISVELVVATDGPDTDFTAKLIDVYPASADYPCGYALNLCDGVVRLRYCADPERETFSTPATVHRIEITLPPVANRFMPGHRIRLDISSSNFPKYEVNSNTGEPEGRARRKRIATNTIFVDDGRASRIILPIVTIGET
jgi:putative CocE/NonD family hydrolase